MAKHAVDPGLATFVGERDDLIALAHSVVGSRHIAEELVQDSWIRWSGQTYATDEARPILFRIVKNLAVDWYRRRRREVEHLTSQDASQEVEFDTEHKVIARQELRLAIKALEQLPPRTLQAFRLSRLEGLTLRETGQRLGVSEARACQLVSKALLHVVQALDTAH